MTAMKTPLTEETRNKCIDVLKLSIATKSECVDSLFMLKSKLNNSEAKAEISNSNRELLDSLADFIILLCYVNLDLSTTYKHYLTSKLPYERRFALKNANVIMIEGYKKMYGYSDNHLKEAFWLTNMKRICEKLPKEFMSEYELLTPQIIELGSSGVFDKNSRDYAIHYDHNVEKVYKMLLSIDGEEFTNRIDQYIEIMNSLYQFSQKILSFVTKELLNISKTIETN